MWSDIPGWFNFYETYDTMVNECPDGGTIVEVGVAFGRSIAYLARRVIESKKQIKIYGVDPWVDDYSPQNPQTWGHEFAQFGRDIGGPFSAFVHCMTKHAPAELERINVCRCKSAEAAKFIDNPFGVMVDGNHSYEAVLQDVDLWLPRMAPGGILAGDDYSANHPEVVRAMQEHKDSFEVWGTTWVWRIPS